MNFKFTEMHVVNIVYVDGEEENISFGKETTAREFVRRQNKLPQVHNAKYIGNDPHGKEVKKP